MSKANKLKTREDPLSCSTEYIYHSALPLYEVVYALWRVSSVSVPFGVYLLSPSRVVARRSNLLLLLSLRAVESFFMKTKLSK